MKFVVIDTTDGQEVTQDDIREIWGFSKEIEMWGPYLDEDGELIFLIESFGDINCFEMNDWGEKRFVIKFLEFEGGVL